MVSLVSDVDTVLSLVRVASSPGDDVLEAEEEEEVVEELAGSGDIVNLGEEVTGSSEGAAAAVLVEVGVLEVDTRLDKVHTHLFLTKFRARPGK